MGMNEGLAALLSLVAGAVMSVTVSCVWTVLHLPARLQDVFQAGSPRMFAWAMLSGLALASVAMTPGIGRTAADMGRAGRECCSAAFLWGCWPVPWRKSWRSPRCCCADFASAMYR